MTIASLKASPFVTKQQVPTGSYCWTVLARMRQRGQRPMDGVWITDHWQQRNCLEESGLLSVSLPSPEHLYLLAGLEVALIAYRSPRLVELAQAIANASPSRFVILWRGQDLQQVLP